MYSDYCHILVEYHTGLGRVCVLGTRGVVLEYFLPSDLLDKNGTGNPSMVRVFYYLTKTTKSTQTRGKHELVTIKKPNKQKKQYKTHINVSL